MSGIRLLSTDFDGTLAAHSSGGRCPDELAETLLRFHHRGAKWAINTGRSLEHMLEGLEVFGAPIVPDFLLTQEREIYRRSAPDQWIGASDWNLLCRERHDALFHESSGVLARLEREFSGLPDVTLIEENGLLAGLVTSDESVMDRVAEKFDGFRGEYPDLAFQRNTVYLRFCHRAYHKGASLVELRRILSLDASMVFAAGDHFNDLSMLDPRIAAHLACPENAIATVKESVSAAGGFVSSKPAGRGVAEALAAALENGKAGAAAEDGRRP